MTISFPEFHAAHCVRFRYRYSDCRRCADSCPHDALAVSDEGVAIDETRCQNCALCTSACRSGALVAGNLPRIDLLRRAITQPDFSFACAPSESKGDAIVPCLGALDSVMLGYLAKRGIPVELRGGHFCPQCPHGEKGAAQLALNLEGETLLQAAATNEQWSDIRLEIPDGHASGPREAQRAGRRQLFRRLIGRGMDALAGGQHDPEPVPDNAIRAARHVSTDQRELLKIVGKLPDAAPYRLAPHAALPLMEIDLGEGCTACEACFRACPSGAIAIEESLTAWALTFQADRCFACEVCVEVCQPGVLMAASRADVSPDRPGRTLHRLSKQRCTGCERFFVSPEPRELCSICLDDENAFAEIFG